MVWSCQYVLYVHTHNLDEFHQRIDDLYNEMQCWVDLDLKLPDAHHCFFIQ